MIYIGTALIYAFALYDWFGELWHWKHCAICQAEIGDPPATRPRPTFQESVEVFRGALNG